MMPEAAPAPPTPKRASDVVDEKIDGPASAEKTDGPAAAGAPPMKRAKKEKTPEQIAVAAEEAAKKAAQKEQAKLQREADREAKKTAAEEAKQERARLRSYLKKLGDELKLYVQGRDTSMTVKMGDAEFDHVFGNYGSDIVSKKIIEECTYRDGSVKRFVKSVENPGLSLGGSDANSIFGVTKCKGGSYNGWHGETTWHITSMQVKKISDGRVNMKWTLSDGAMWGRY